MEKKRPRPVVLVVRDGWGRNPHPKHEEFNAILRASTPRCDALLREYPWTLVKTSGEDVGLPDGTMGNSEVGHQNLGAGRIVDQDSVRITKAIRTGEIFDNEALVGGVRKALANDGAVHLFSLCSDAGVHGLLTHLYAVVELCHKLGQQRVYLHLFTDGRDTGPYTGQEFVHQVEERCAEIGVGRVATLCGRYYAMDRDNRWERVQRAYDALTGRSDTPRFDTAEEAMQHYYDAPTNDSQQGDEFVTPRVVGTAEEAAASRVKDGDTVIFTNYRGDRPREIIRAFVFADFHGCVAPSPDSGEKGFERGPKLDLSFVTMTAYEEELNAVVDVAFPRQPPMDDIAGAYLAKLGLKQFRCAETEKFPHVTFFFNDYRDEPFRGESRQMAQSPKVATYDLQPEMSAEEVCAAVLGRIAADDCEDFILVNFANTDMVGHTGKLDAAVQAAEKVDDCVGRIVDATLARGGKLVVTADHGNSEQMFDPKTEAPHTAHTTYDVECIVVDPDRRADAMGSAVNPSPSLRSGGRLADVMPTVFELMGLQKPTAMTGESLLG